MLRHSPVLLTGAALLFLAGVLQTADVQAQEIIVKHIGFQLEESIESVTVELNNDYVPDFFPIEGDKPRIVFDFKPVSFWDGPTRIKVGGKYIQRIRIHLHSDTATLRVVLDLNPAEDFYATPTFFKSKNACFMKMSIQKNQ